MDQLGQNDEIARALRQFEAEEKARTGGPSAPTSVEAEGPQDVSLYPRSAAAPSETDEKPSGLVKLVMKLSGGAIKTKKQAEWVLVGFVAVAVIVSFFLFNSGSGSTANTSPIYQEDLTPTIRATLPESVLKTIPYRK